LRFKSFIEFMILSRRGDAIIIEYIRLAHICLILSVDL